MNRTLRLAASFCLLLGIAITLPATAVSAAKKTTPASKNKPEPPTHQTITVVSGNTITVAGKKDSKTYTISNFTEILVNGKRTDSSGLQVGMYVTLGADSKGIASLINAQTPPEHKKTK